MTQFKTGNPLDPPCGTNLGRRREHRPVAQRVFVSGTTGLTSTNSRCELTGEPIFSGYTPDPNVADAFQVHFNPNAFRRPRPNGGIGNLGNAPQGVLRHPSWWNWDFTLARRIPDQGAGIRPGGEPPRSAADVQHVGRRPVHDAWTRPTTSPPPATMRRTPASTPR